MMGACAKNKKEGRKKEKESSCGGVVGSHLVQKLSMPLSLFLFSTWRSQAVHACLCTKLEEQIDKVIELREMVLHTYM